MPKIIVAKAFNLILSPTGDKLRFEPGVHEVDEDVANHWYVQQHLSAGGPIGAKASRDAADAAFLAAQAAGAEYMRLEEAAQRAETEAGVEVSEPAYRRLAAREDDRAADTAEAAPEKPRRGRRPKAEAQAELEGGDTATAPLAADTLLGGQGNDVLQALGDAGDSLVGGVGEDVIEGASGPAPDAEATAEPAEVA